MNRTVFIALLVAVCASSLAQAQDKPREVRYCTNCATVEALKPIPAGGGAYGVEMVLRYSDGKVKTFRYDNDPGLRVGEKVKDNNGVVVRDVPEKKTP